MYFWVKNCVFLNPPLQNSNDFDPPPYSIENSVPQKSTQDPVKGDNPKIQLYLTVLFLLIIAPLPVYFIVTGINQSCPVEPNLPFWMIVVGFCLFMEIVFTGHINSKKYIQHKNSAAAENSEVTGRPALMIILRKSIRLSVFGLSIIGFIWSCLVLSDEQPENCSNSVIWPSFILSFLVLLFSTFVFIYYSCIVCCTLLDYFENKSQN